MERLKKQAGSGTDAGRQSIPQNEKTVCDLPIDSSSAPFRTEHIPGLCKDCFHQRVSPQVSCALSLIKHTWHWFHNMFLFNLTKQQHLPVPSILPKGHAQNAPGPAWRISTVWPSQAAELRPVSTSMPKGPAAERSISTTNSASGHEFRTRAAQTSMGRSVSFTPPIRHLAKSWNAPATEPPKASSAQPCHTTPEPMDVDRLKRTGIQPLKPNRDFSRGRRHCVSQVAPERPQ